jgi:hypothetical protein
VGGDDDFFVFRNRPALDLREAKALEDRLRRRALVNPVDGLPGRREARLGDRSRA